MTTTVAASGYFDPLHVGHIEYLKKAKELAGNKGRLIVIVNSDEQAILKKGFVFMPEKERVAILRELSMVDEVVLSIDEDETVCESLEWIKPDIFAKGGDRYSDEIPESETCKRNRIEIVDGLGKKIQSSQDLIEGASNFL